MNRQISNRLHIDTFVDDTMVVDSFHKHIELEFLGDVPVVTVTTRTVVDEQIVRELGEQLFKLAEDAGPHEFLFNLGSVQHLGSHGLGMLLKLNGIVQSAGGRLILCNLNPLIAEVLKAAGLNRVFEIRSHAPPAPGRKEQAHTDESPHEPDTQKSVTRLSKSVVLCDPLDARAPSLVKQLSRDLNIVHVSDLQAMERFCQMHTPAAVALPLNWSKNPVSATPKINPALRQFLQTNSVWLSILVYTDKSQLPVQMASQVLSDGAKQIVDEASPEFAHELRQQLVRLVDDHLAELAEREQLINLFAEHDLIGRSRELREVFLRAQTASEHGDLTVLIVGETGTGKQLLAQAIHNLDSQRAEKPFQPVNCSAISSSLVESELFGHVKGAFSGAERDRLGLFRAADGGTVLLDEIGELPLDQQPKLLRVLQDRCLLPVGADREQSVDVRVIAASNRPLEQMVIDRQFRADLYHRLNVFSIHIPPLRERPEDIEVQARYFLERYQKDYENSVTELSLHVCEALHRLPWEGNSRQLENLIHETLVSKPPGPALQLEDLPGWVRELVANLPWPRLEAEQPSSPPTEPVASPVQQAVGQGLSRKQAVEQFEREFLRQALMRNDGNRTRTAAEIGMTTRGLLKKIKKYNLD